MFWFILFLLGVLCAVICVAALLVWLTAAVLAALADCAAQGLANFNGGRVIIGLLYVVPAALLLCALGQGCYLAHSFYMAVFK
jgi:hypothetical protein